MRFNEARKLMNDFKKVEKTINQMVGVAGAVARDHYVQSFRDQGFTDEVIEPWKKRKKMERRGRGRQFSWHRHAGTYESEGKRFKVKEVDVRSVKAGRAILVKSGALRRSIRFRAAGLFKVVIYSNLPYANVHNEGGRAGRGKGFQMPKRRFIGYSSLLNRKILRKFDEMIRRVFS